MFHDRLSIPFSPTPAVADALTAYLSPSHLASYATAAKNDRSLMFRLYRWNAQLCETMHFPCQILEIGFRNRVAAAFSDRISYDWPFLHDSEKLQFLMPKAQGLIKEAKERACEASKHATVDAVIAILSFGFWCRMLHKSYENSLWAEGIRSHFPYLPEQFDRQKFYKRMMAINDFRNMIAHHTQVFNKDPLKYFGYVINAIQWIDEDVKEFTREATRDFRIVYDARPQ